MLKNNSSYVVFLILFSSVLLGLGSFQTVYAQSDPTSVDIGALLPQTGRADNAGEHRTFATELAISDFNAYLEDKGAQWRLNLVAKDTSASNSGTLAAVQELYDEGVQYLSGPSRSAGVSTILPFLNTNDMLTISCCSTAPSLAISNDNAFRLAPDDTYHGPVIANLMYDAGKKHMIAIYLNDSFGRGLQETTIAAFEELGGTTDVSTVGGYEKCSLPGCYGPIFDDKVKILSDHVSDLIQSGTSADDLVILFIGFGETVDFVQRASQDPVLRSVNIQLVGSDANVSVINNVSDPDLLEFLTDSNFRSCIFAADTTSDRYHGLKSRLDAQFPVEPVSVYAYSSYDSIWVLGLAIENAGGSGATFADVKAQIRPTAADYVGSLGDIALNEFGDLEGSSYSVWGMEDSLWQHLGTYVPGKGFVPLMTSDTGNGSDKEHLSRPTFGVSYLTGLQQVSCGYSMDGTCRDVLDYHVDYKRDTIMTGTTHDITLKAYSQRGIDYFQIGFGVEGVGSPSSSAEAMITVHVSMNYSDSTYVIDDIVYVDPNNILGTDATFSVDMEECMLNSPNQCVVLTISELLFREQMYHEPFLIEAVDTSRYNAVHYMNDGLQVNGPSMNTAPSDSAGVLKTSSQHNAVHIHLVRIDKLADIWQDQFGHTWTKNAAGTWYYVDGPEITATPVCNNVDDRICPAFAKKYEWHTERMEQVRDSAFTGLYAYEEFNDLAEPVTIYDTDGDSRTAFLIENNMMWIRD